MPSSVTRPRWPWAKTAALSHTLYLEGQRDLVSSLIMGISRGTKWVIRGISLLTKVPLTLQVKHIRKGTQITGIVLK